MCIEHCVPKWAHIHLLYFSGFNGYASSPTRIGLHFTKSCWDNLDPCFRSIYCLINGGCAILAGKFSFLLSIDFITQDFMCYLCFIWSTCFLLLFVVKIFIFNIQLIMQARNNARILISGSIDLFSNRYVLKLHLFCLSLKYSNGWHFFNVI